MSGCFADSHSLSVKQADSRTGGAFSGRSSVNQVFLRTGARNANAGPFGAWPVGYINEKNTAFCCAFL